MNKGIKITIATLAAALATTVGVGVTAAEAQPVLTAKVSGCC